jgi:hypothetical protein
LSEISFEKGKGLLVEGTTSSYAVTSLSISQSWFVVILTKGIVEVLDIEEVIKLRDELQRQRHINIEKIWIISLNRFSDSAIKVGKEMGILFTDKDRWLELETIILECID